MKKIEKTGDSDLTYKLKQKYEYLNSKIDAILIDEEETLN
jgi:hypothetical protein